MDAFFTIQGSDFCFLFCFLVFVHCLELQHKQIVCFCLKTVRIINTNTYSYTFLIYAFDFSDIYFHIYYFKNYHPV